MSQGQTTRRRKTAIGEVLSKTRDYRFEQMKLELYDLPKAFFEDEVARDYYDTAKKLLNEKHEAAELIFAELKEMITFGYRTGNTDGKLEEGWNTKTNKYEFRTPEEWAKGQKPKVEQETDGGQTDDSVKAGTTETPSETTTESVTTPNGKWPLEAVKDLVPPPDLIALQKLETDSSLENVPVEDRLVQLGRLMTRLQIYDEKVLGFNKDDNEALNALGESIGLRIFEIDSELRKVKAEELREASKKERATGKINFKSFPNLKMPEQGATAMPGVGYLEAEINGQLYRIYAGQDFLNTEYCQHLFENPPTKSGNIALYQGGSRYPDTDDYKCLVVGDAHHRFIWGAHHNQAVTAQFEPKPFALTVHDWQNITYQHNPKHEYTFDVNDKNDPLKANANDSVKKKLFLAAVSPRSEYAGKFAKDAEGFIRTNLEKFWKDIQKGFVLEDKEFEKVKKYLQGLVKTAEPRSL
ncbi:MAG: hypothetical protein QM775_14280 [Pirellulales bacterium]